MKNKKIKYYNNLQKYMTYKNLTIEKLSKEINISMSQLSLISSNKAYPRENNRIKILNYFNLSFNQMFYKN